MKDFLSWYQNSGWTKCPTAKLLATGIISKLAQQETPFIGNVFARHKSYFINPRKMVNDDWFLK